MIKKMKIDRENLDVSDATLEKLELYDLVENDKATASEIMCLSYLTGAITKAEYADYLKIEKNCKD